MPEPPTFYVNSINAQGGPFELTFDFGYRLGDEDFTPNVRVLMSWEHAKIMTGMIGQLVSEYEARVGTAIPDIQGTITETEAAK